MTVCTPPAGTPGGTWHWVRKGKQPPEISFWDAESQIWTSGLSLECWGAKEFGRLGYRYLEPVTPPRAENGGGDA